MHLAFHLYWLLTSFVEDDPGNTYAQSVRAACEMAVVNAQPNAAHVDGKVHASAESKVLRSEYFSSVVAFVDSLVRTSGALRSLPPDPAERLRVLQERLGTAWAGLSSGAAPYIPLWTADSRHFSIVRLPPREALLLNSHERVPYMLHFEVLWSAVETSSTVDLHSAASQVADIDRLVLQLHTAGAAVEATSAIPSAAAAEDAAPVAAEVVPARAVSTEEAVKETWVDRKARMARESPFASNPSWDILSVIVKYGDDCRAEFLALQLLSQMKRIFDRAALPLWLKPHGLLVCGARAALIETIPNVQSIHQCKKTHATMGELFRERFGVPDSPAYELAQRNFAESLAGYSLACYVLAIKDRHNGNILVDEHGHVIHIDFGFMLGTSPGSLQFESAPFKLVPEWLDLMGGADGDLFHYFKALLVKGFMELRKHSQELLALLQMMTFRRGNVKQPIACLRNGDAAVAGVQRRLDAVGKTEPEVVASVNQLVEAALTSKSTRLYDEFQWWQGGIRK